MPAAYFFLSDITGYTAYLTASELEHAQEILSALFETLLNSIKPPLRVAKLEGDAIFAYLPAEAIGYGQTILDTVENMYSGFRQTQQVMRLNTTCTCRACNGIDSLDLKFFLHYGEYALQRLMGQEELAGSAIILAHRLMKNTASEKTGLRAYAMFTQAALEAMQVQPEFQSLIPHQERYEHLGETSVFLYDLHAFWERSRQQRRVFVAPEQAEANAHIHVAAPPAVVWDIMTNPATRGLVVAGEMSVSGRQDGRIGIGATYHCSHHDGSATDQLILDWQPLEYITTRDRMQILDMEFSLLCTDWIKANSDGTSQVIFSISVPQAEDALTQAQIDEMWLGLKAELVRHVEGHAGQAYAEILAGRGY
ncbi:MAG: DUF2652 domain-containing protein [Anaerolineales bacterium]|nr:DUF2652 domain-containing protein [Anaerolineales bacterium]